MVDTFQHAALPQLIFGAGSISRLPELVKPYGTACLILTGKSSFTGQQVWGEVQAQFKAAGISHSHEVIGGEPSPLWIDEIVSRNKDKNSKVVIAIGGGSVLDAGKAVSAMLCHNHPTKSYLEGVGDMKPCSVKIPFIAVPTTAGTGSEATKNAVLSEVGPTGYKKSLRHDAYVPEVALIDPALTLSASPQVTAAAGMDAFTQLLEAYLSVKASPFTDALAYEGLSHIKEGLLAAVSEGSNLSARSHMAYAAYLSGVCLANAGLGLVHGYASSVGGKIDIPHGALCGTLMGVVNEMTLEKILSGSPAPIAMGKYARVGKLFLGEKAYQQVDYAKALIELIQEWTEKLSLPNLSSYGLTKEMITDISSATAMKNHPVQFSQEEKEEVLRRRL
ncbi:MAG: iron-containing alcohol dehydrogenase [Bacteroidota bacterium]